MGEIGNAARAFELEDQSRFPLVLMLRAVGDAFREIAALARPHVAVVGLAHALERDAELVERVPMARRAIALAVHQPGEIHPAIRDAGIERESLGEDLTLAADRLLDQRTSATLTMVTSRIMFSLLGIVRASFAAIVARSPGFRTALVVLTHAAYCARREITMIPRYTRPEMAAIWEPQTRFRIWFEIEAHAADAMAELGIIPKEAGESHLGQGARTRPSMSRASMRSSARSSTTSSRS